MDTCTVSLMIAIDPMGFESEAVQAKIKKAKI